MLNEVINIRPNVEWQAMFDTLVRFTQQYGHCNVPRDFRESPDLSRWTERQRLLREFGNLSQERQQRLEELGFEWTRQATKKTGPHGKKHST
jgi:negative regulator of genetic competence, sporulation and motility